MNAVDIFTHRIIFSEFNLVSFMAYTYNMTTCKVLNWGLFGLPAYVANVMKMFAIFSGCNTHLLVGFYCMYVGEA